MQKLNDLSNCTKNCYHTLYIYVTFIEFSISMHIFTLPLFFYLTLSIIILLRNEL